MNPLFRLGLELLEREFLGLTLLFGAIFAVGYAIGPLEMGAVPVCGYSLMGLPYYARALLSRLEYLSRVAPFNPARRLRTYLLLLGAASLWTALGVAAVSFPWQREPEPFFLLHLANLLLLCLGGVLLRAISYHIAAPFPCVVLRFPFLLVIGLLYLAEFYWDPGMSFLCPLLWVPLLPAVGLLAGIYWEVAREAEFLPASQLESQRRVQAISDSKWTGGRLLEESAPPFEEVPEAPAPLELAQFQVEAQKLSTSGLPPAISLLRPGLPGNVPFFIILSFLILLFFMGSGYGSLSFLLLVAGLGFGETLRNMLSKSLPLFLPTPYPRLRAFLILAAPVLAVLAIMISHHLIFFRLVKDLRLMSKEADLGPKGWSQLVPPEWWSRNDRKQFPYVLKPGMEPTAMAKTIRRFFEEAYGLRTDDMEILSLHPGGEITGNAAEVEARWLEEVESRYRDEVLKIIFPHRFYDVLFLLFFTCILGFYPLPSRSRIPSRLVSGASFILSIMTGPVVIFFFLLESRGNLLKTLYPLLELHPGLLAALLLAILLLAWRHYRAFRRLTVDQWPLLESGWRS
ncbi:MAG: hypothetical protein HY717_11070 [Planctomycetes bacterium]|nr:hypothetical protein [Planctomycetota bacterium]